MTASNAGANTGSALNVSNATTGSGTAVEATVSGASNTGSAVWAVNNSTTGWGVYSSGTSPNYFAGNVGIGTTAPNSTLEIDNTASYAAATTNPMGGQLILQSPSGSSGHRTYLGSFYTSGTGEVTALQSSSYYSGADHDYYLSLNPNGGNVGIGTTTAADTLDVNGNVGVYGGNYLDLYKTGNSVWAQINMDSSQELVIQNGNGDEDLDALNNIKFATWTGAAYTNALTITATQRVGIGTTSPAGQLDVESAGSYAGYFNNTSTGYALYAAGSNAGSTPSNPVGATAYIVNNSTTWPAPALYLSTGCSACYAIYGHGEIEASNVVAGDAGIYVGNSNTWLTQGGSNELYLNGSDLRLAASKYINFGSTDGTSGYGIRDNGGTIQLKNSGGSWANITSSDRRLKRDIVDLPKDDGLAAIMKLRPVRFHWKDVQQDKEEGGQIGFIAQEVEKVYPTGVTYNFGNVTMTLADGKKETVEHARGMNYDRLVSPLIKAVQEQQDEIEKQNAEISALQKEIAALKQEKH